jgi:TRAP-type C4-dicarboxylate transport system substrate-binding protein
MMKRLISLAGACAMLLSAGSAFADAVTIRYSSWLPTNHWYVASNIVPYLEEIETVTEGRVKVDILPKTVGTPQSQFDVVRDGLADMSWIVVGYTPGRFKLAEMGELPLTGDTTSTGPAFHRLYMKHFADANEFDGVALLAVYTGSAGHVATRGKKVQAVADFKGLKLRSASNAATEALNLLGAVPILKSASETYELLSTGAIDGSLMIPETVVSTNGIDFLDSFTVVPDGLFNTVHAIVVNQDKWNEIAPEDQQAILAISGEKLAKTVGESYARENAKAFEAMKAKGYAIDTLSPEEGARLKTALSPVEQKWIDVAKQKGIADPAAVLAELRAASARSSD